MKKLIVLLAGLAFAATTYAADNENTESTKVDRSKNPFTGTETTTKKYNKKVKDGSDSSDAEVTEKTKVKPDGTVSRDVDVEAESESKGQ